MSGFQPIDRPATHSMLRRTVRRADVIQVLEEFSNHIDNYLCQLPGYMMGISCTEIIDAAIITQNKIAVVKQLFANAIGDEEALFDHTVVSVGTMQINRGRPTQPMIAVSGNPYELRENEAVHVVAVSDSTRPARPRTIPVRHGMNWVIQDDLSIIQSSQNDFDLPPARRLRVRENISEPSSPSMLSMGRHTNVERRS